MALDRQRQDFALSELSAVASIPSRTAGNLPAASRAGIWLGSKRVTRRCWPARWAVLSASRRPKPSRSVTIDMDSTDVEVYGSRKQQVAYNYAGQRAGRQHLATWAEAGLSTAAELLAGNDDVRSTRRGHATPRQGKYPRSGADRAGRGRRR